jgi:hypothetical protein
MGTDRTEVHRGPCYCRNGQFLIERSEPGQYESSVECGECNRRFSIIERRNQFVLVENVDIEARHDLRNHTLTLRDTFMHRADVQNLLRRLAATLDSFRYKRHIYRFLLKHGISVEVGPATFVRNWSNATSWVERHITSPKDIHKVAVALEYNAIESLVADLREIERAEARLKVSLPTVGEPIYEHKGDSWRGSMSFTQTLQSEL